jgi:hypothetical protein
MHIASLLPPLLALLTFSDLNHASALPSASPSTPNYSPPPNRHNYSKRLAQLPTDEIPKYFMESSFHPHYDARFATKQLSYSPRKEALSSLVTAFLNTMADLQIETWLAHGSLLGWWWNKRIQPWDSDIDMQMTIESLDWLAENANNTRYFYQTPRMKGGGRTYLLEVNPHYVVAEWTLDPGNVIDARWIDTSTGLFIDLTAVRKLAGHPSGPNVLGCKDGHQFDEGYVFPLRETYFEGQKAMIPWAYEEILVAEYGEDALSNTVYEGHQFDEERMEWMPTHRMD